LKRQVFKIVELKAVARILSTNFDHHKGLRVTLSGKPGDDARHYQEKEVRTKIEEASK
jgi:hypothetical protein